MWCAEVRTSMKPVRRGKGGVGAGGVGTREGRGMKEGHGTNEGGMQHEGVGMWYEGGTQHKGVGQGRA